MKVIITGATGMVGEGVMHECLLHPDVKEILLLSRRPSGVVHDKIKEVIHDDLLHLETFAGELAGYDACFFCLGVSSIGKSEAEYTRVTYDLTLHVAGILADQNPEMVFCYVTGGGTDSSEQGRSMWARVKGRTENALLRLPFKDAYMFRPGYIHPTEGLSHSHAYYKVLGLLYPMLRKLIPRHVTTLKELGLSMIHIVQKGYEKKIVDNLDMAKLAHPE
ncbi:NAD-dependent epimerase/dehydratase family protein [Paenibacillus paeoniae]|uniref:NAD-dependent epimerase/dehydratase family protein n=1 Tax=Paenibacillus paeoniae TaxID=2292705 RepID=A0A371PLT5_9BACL|nr:NAD-dependent epimerase/dehydratase family protein [Paenibacillus paeoniae]REK77164.1 NAD-dependent epimerase/dehydratase family protein [Paenibacillus paeoniae]